MIMKGYKKCTTCLTFQQKQLKNKTICHNILIRPWDVIGADMFTLDNKQYICIVDYHSKFPIVKKTKDLSADGLILTCEIIFGEYGVLKKIMSDSGGNFISDKLKTFCKSLNRKQAFSSSYHYQSSDWVEACIKFVKCTLKKCFDSRSDPQIALLQMQMTPLGQGLPSPAMMLFNCPVRGIMPVINRTISIDNGDEHQVIIKGQAKNDKDKGTSKNFVHHNRVYCSGSMQSWGTVDP